MPRNTLWLFVPALVACLLACQPEVPIELSEPSEIQEPQISSEIVLGKRLNNPYSLKNMRQAARNLSGTQPGGGSGEPLKATHLYVRYLPTETAHVQAIRADTALAWFNYPLDYEIVQGGSTYHDPNLPTGVIGAFYTVVPVGNPLPAGPYELLDSCYQPSDETLSADVRAKVGVSFAKLEEEAFRITGNLPEEHRTSRGERLFPSKKFPTGRFRMLQPSSNTYVPFRRVRVRCRSLTNVATAYTDAYGNYTMTVGFRYNPTYSIELTNAAGFTLHGRADFVQPTTFTYGIHANEGWGQDFNAAASIWTFATVNNASYDYYTRCSAHGVSTPPSRLKIWVYNIPGTNLITGSAPMLSKTFGLTGFNTDNNVVDFLLNANRITVSLNVVASLTKFLQPDITLFIRNGYTGNEIIHRVVYHELAHASHWRIVGNTFWQRYINYIISYGITNPPYGDGMGVNAELCGVGEMWGNYFGAVIEREVYGRVPSFTGTWTWLDEDEDWYNPGFLRKADSIADISTAEVFSSIGASTQSFNTLIYQLQLRTNFDNLVQEKYDFYSDWP